MKTKIRENRQAVLDKMQEGEWYAPQDLGVEFFLLDRMADKGLVERKFDVKSGSFGVRYKKLDKVAI